MVLVFLQAAIVAEETAQGVLPSLGWEWIAAAVGFVIATILIILFIKKVIVNSILGLIGWAIAVYVFHLPLPFWISLVASALFGLAGVGVMILLKIAGVF